MTFKKFGQGKIVIGDNDRVHYEGTISPELVGEDVVIMKQDDLELMIESDTNSLMITAREMDSQLYDCNQPNSLPDEVIMEYNDQTEQKMFLDRAIYSSNFKDMIWIRYVSVDQSFVEENEQPTKTQKKE